MSAAEPAKPALSAAEFVAKAAEGERPTAAQVARQVRHERARNLARALLFWVGLPTLLAVVYYGFVARQQYESVSTLVLRGAEDQASLHATTFTEYALSREMLGELDRDVGFSKHYRDRGDALSRLAGNAGSETRYDFFRQKVDARYDAVSHVLTLRVRSFSGEAAQQFCAAILERASRFVQSVDDSTTQALIVVAKPSAPSEAKYPRRAYEIVTVFLASLAIFSIGSLLIAAVREHAQF